MTKFYIVLDNENRVIEKHRLPENETAPSGFIEVTEEVFETIKPFSVYSS